MAGMTSYAKQTRQFSVGGVCKLCALALVAVACLGVQADTKLWYRFDDKPDGYRTTGSDTFSNAVDPATYPGQPYTVGGGISTWETTTTSAMPTYSWGFPDGYCVRDPLTDTIHSNTGSVYLVNSTTNINGRSGAVIVPDDPALYGDAFTIEFFVRGLVYLNDPWQTFFSRVDSNGNYTMVLRDFRTNIQGACYFVTNGVRTYAEIASYNMGTGTMLNKTWHHVAITVDQTQFTLKLYVDYALRRTVTLPGPLDISGAGYIVLGRGNDNYGFFQGEFDELRVSEGALAPDQFLHLHYSEDPRVFYRHSFMPAENLFSPLKVIPTASYVATNTPASFANISEWTDTAWRTNECVGLVQSSEAGVNAALSIPLNDPHILTNGDFTIEFFVRIPPGGTKSESYLIELNDGVRARFQNGSSTLTVLKAWSGAYSIPLADDYWHHIAWVVKRSTGSVNIYYDYALFGGISYTMPNLSSAAKVSIGSYSNGDLKFNTLWLDEVRITKAALDADTLLRPKRDATLETCRVSFSRPLDDFLSYGYGFNGRTVVRPTPWGTLTLDETNRPSAMIYDGNLDSKGYTNTVSAGFIGSSSNGSSGFYKVPDDKANPMVTGSFTAEMFIYLDTSGGWGLNVCNQCFMGQSNAFRMDFWQSGRKISGVGPSGGSFVEKVLDLKRWYHIAYIQDVEHDELRLYVDRKLVGTKRGIPARNGDPGDFIYLMASPIQDYYGCFSSAWADEARFTRRVLDPEEFLRPYPNGGLYIIFR